MNTTITARKMTLKDSTKDYIEKKLSKLDKFFYDEADAKVTASIEGDHSCVEVTINDRHMIYRAQKKDRDVSTAFDMAVDSIVRKIRKHKTKLEKRMKSTSIGYDIFPEKVDEIHEFNIIKTKRFSVKPLDIDEAILQMNLIGHQFYVFRNVEDDEINVVYKRKDGDYAVIQPVQ